MLNKKNSITLLIIITGLIIFITGCSITFKGSKGGDDGGIFATLNRGGTWQQRNLIPTTSGRPKNINALDVNALVIDPSDSKALYFGSVENVMKASTEELMKVEFIGPKTAQYIRETVGSEYKG